MPQGPQECTNPQRNYAGKGTQNLSRNIARKEIYLLFFEYQPGDWLLFASVVADIRIALALLFYL